jgi:hypothetical protein
MIWSPNISDVTTPFDIGAMYTDAFLDREDPFYKL